MAAVRDDFSSRRDRKTSKNLRQEYSNLINMDEGLIEARRWIERITFTPFKHSDFRESLADGVLLCELVVNVASMSIGRINRSSTAYASTDNLKLFQRACETLGFDGSQVFDITDLQEVPVKRGQSVFERAKESQRRLAKVALTVYWLGKYANDNLNFTGSSSLKEACFQHLLENQFPELPDIEGEELAQRREAVEAVQQAEPKESIKDKHEIVTETVDYSTKIQTFKELEEESKRVQEETERQRRRSFSSSDKENQFIDEERENRRKSVGSKPVWKEGDSRYKHKKEILGGWKDPLKNRRDRIVQGTGESPPKEPKLVGLNMRSPGDMRGKLSRFEQMNRQASEESEVIQGKRSRPKSWGGGDLLSRGGSLSDKTNKFESLQRQADKQTMVLEGKHREMENDFEYDIGDKVSGPISLPGSTDVKLREKKRQFESLDYKAQRESSFLKLHSGKSFDDSTQRPKPSQPRPKSNVFDYQRFPQAYEPERSSGESEDIQAREMNFTESSPEQNEIHMQNEFPPAPPRGDSLRYYSLTKRPEEAIMKEAKGKTSLYSSFAPSEDPNKEGTAKRPPMKYKEFVSYPITKQRDRVERYNAALQQLSKEPERKTSEQSTGRPRKKSIGNDEWIKVRPVEEPLDDIPKRPIQKLWDREPEDEEGEQTHHKKQSQTVDTSFAAVEKSTYVPDVKNFRYKDFAAPPPKSVVKDVVMSSTSVTVESSGPRKISGTGSGPYSNFAQQTNQDSNKPAKKASMSYRDFVVPPPKGESASEAEQVKAKKVKDLTKRFMELEAEQFKPKESGPPQPKSLVDRDELVRYERESRARSWYGGPLGLDDDEFEGAFRRRVRRLSDYEYGEEDRTKSSPWEQGPEPDQYDGVQGHKRPEMSATTSDRYQSYNGSIEPEIEVRKKPQVESSRWQQPQPSANYPPPRPAEPPMEPEPVPYGQTYEQDVKPVRSTLQHSEPEPEPPRHEDQPPSREDHSYRPTTSTHIRTIGTRSWNGQTYEQDVKPVTSTLQHSEPEPEPEPLRPEDQPPSREGHSYRPPTSTHIRTIGTRSWNEFESSRRKKSMELLDSRPAARPPYESKEQEKGKGETDIYKLKRPADYLPKYKAEQVHKPPSQPAYHEPPKPAETYHHYFQSNTQDDFAPLEKHPQSQPDRYEEEPMPTSYPTFYQPDGQHPNGVAPTEVVQAGKPLIVSAKLHDETQEPKPVHRPLPGDQAYEFVATSETPDVVESTPDLEAPPKTDFKTQQKLWEDLSSHKHIQPDEEPVAEAFPVKELQVEKHVAVQPEMPKPQNVEAREGEVVPVTTKSKRPQVFAIVGRQGSQFRPVVAEMPEPVAVSPKHPKEDITPLVTKEEPRAVQEQTRQQHPGNRMISPLLSGAKVFNFEEENKRDAAKRQPHTEKQPIPTNKKETVVVETVSVVEKSRGVDADIFRALDDYEDEKLKRNMHNPEYREKLRKEVEEKNQKQREEARYLTNLQMRQSLGTKDMVNDDEGNVRQEHFEGLQSAGENLEYMYDYNANRTEDYDRKGDRYYEDPRNRPDQRQYDIDRRERERIENERREYEQRERERQEQERREWERREQERLEHERRGKERSERERREQERLEHEHRQEQKPREYEQRKRERQEQERREWERREQERIEHERKEKERLEHERRKEQGRREYEQRERERQERERLEWERREQERLEHERREKERIEHERRKERERQEQERREWERKEQERLEHERREKERIEHERREHERREQERMERERHEQERREWERKEQERLEHERREKERMERERQEQERLEHERREQERRERERQAEEERLEHERREQERIELERREQEKLEHERVEQQLREQERIEGERRRQEQLERERYEQDRRRQGEQRQRGRHGPIERERRHDPRDTQRRHEYRDEERYDPRDTQRRHEYRDQERYDPRDRDRERYEKERIHRERREQERLDQERKERERRERHRREQENLAPEERERHRLEQQRRVHEMVEQQQRKEQEYRKSLSREDHHIHSMNYQGHQKESTRNWTKIDDGSRYSIYETYIAADQKRVVCTNCGQPINKDTAMFVQELNRYWHKDCFRCVVCQVIFGTKEQRSPLMVSNSLLHCENCFITNEGEKLTEV